MFRCVLWDVTGVEIDLHLLLLPVMWMIYEHDETVNDY